MKPRKPLKLALKDVHPDLGADVCKVLEFVAASPRYKVGRKFVKELGRHIDGLVLWDWRAVACAYLRRKFPKFWIYRGGSHIAIHASPPRDRRQSWGHPDGEAGALLAVIHEAGK